MQQKITGEVKISPATLNITQKIKNVLAFKEKVEEFSEKSVTELSEIIFGGGIGLEASDLHIEPEKEQAKIRVRIDGLLQDVMIIDWKTYGNLLSRIKLISGIKLNITDRPQDGRFSISMEEKTPIEVRTSTLPAEYGETIVLRILNPKTLVEIEALGLRKDLLETLGNEIKKPNGMIIVTGPTGSGKTTTLYAFLKKVHKPEIKIITIEDPIEYRLEGVSQTQVNPKKGYDFASGLKSIMRQDPDVILVGEIRDLETAEIALQAALTGHLVFTTLHTNDAAGTVARLTSLGANPSNIGPAINMAIAQRLVREICKKCGGLEKASASVLEKIKRGLKGIPSGIKIPKIAPGLKIPQVKGCKNCNFTGYRGRTGVFEAFLVDEEMEKFILQNPSIAALRKEAIGRGMVAMQQDGLIKVLNGITTIEEVERITGPIE
jgi:type II secretory ATPase GspE/PulE/Tfp pilus assembly ATPase PilB-like protein